MATITVLQYGRYEHGRPARSSGGSWRRSDVYRSSGAPDLDGQIDSLFAAGPSDDSPIYHGPYNGQCSCCYLGFGHTEAAHNARF